MIDLAVNGMIILAVGLMLFLWSINRAPVLSDDQEDLLENIARQQEARRANQRTPSNPALTFCDKNEEEDASSLTNK